MLLAQFGQKRYDSQTSIANSCAPDRRYKRGNRRLLVNPGIRRANRRQGDGGER